MLGFLKPRGELVEINGRTVVFLSAKPYKPEQRFEVRLGLPEPSNQIVAVAIRVQSCRPGPGDFFVIVAIAEGRREPPSLVGYTVRGYPRAAHRISVKSEDLPGYRAVTSNLSRGGLGAILDGELPEGHLVSLHFEFDDPLGWTLDLKARVVWSAWKSQNWYDTGFAFIEDPLYAMALRSLESWLDQRAKHELIPFKPPDKMGPRRPNEVPNQLPQSAARSEALRAAQPIMSYDDDATPLGLPTLVQPVLRPMSLKLPQTEALQRPSALKIPIVEPRKAPDETVAVPTTAGLGDAEVAGQPPVEAEDVGVRIHFEGNLRGWAWEGADDAVVVVLEDIHGTDHWVEFPRCRGLQARCRQREIRLLGMAVAERSALITELTREDGEDPLIHYRFYDDHQRTVLEIVAAECREQIR